MSNDKKELVNFGIEDIVLNLTMFLWPDTHVKKASLNGQFYKHICKMQKGNWKDWDWEDSLEASIITGAYEELPVYYVLLKGKRKIIIKNCCCNECRTVWVDYVVLKEE